MSWTLLNVPLLSKLNSLLTAVSPVSCFLSLHRGFRLLLLFAEHLPLLNEERSMICYTYFMYLLAQALALLFVPCSVLSYSQYILPMTALTE